MSFWDDVLALGPAVLWKMDETSLATANDATGNGRHGTYVNMEVGDLNKPSIIGGEPLSPSVAFDGVNEFINLAHSAWMNAGNNITALGIAYFTDFAAQRELMGKLNRWQVWIEATGKLTFYVSPPWTSVTMDGSLTLAPNTPYLCIVRKDAVLNLISIWINGVKRAELAHSGTLSNSVDDLRFATSSTGPRFLKGRGQGFAYWPSTALADADIANLGIAFGTEPLPPPAPEFTAPLEGKHYLQYVPVRYNEVEDPNFEPVEYRVLAEWWKLGILEGSGLVHDWQSYDPETIWDAWAAIGILEGDFTSRNVYFTVQARDDNGMTSTSPFMEDGIVVEGWPDPAIPIYTLEVVHRRDNQVVFKATAPRVPSERAPEWELRREGEAWLTDHYRSPLQWLPHTKADAKYDSGNPEDQIVWYFWTGPLEPDTDYEVRVRNGIDGGDWSPVLGFATYPRMGSAFRNLVIDRNPYVYWKFREEDLAALGMVDLAADAVPKNLQDESGWHSRFFWGLSAGAYEPSTMPNEPLGTVLIPESWDTFYGRTVQVDRNYAEYFGREPTIPSFHVGFRAEVDNWRTTFLLGQIIPVLIVPDPDPPIDPDPMLYKAVWRLETVFPLPVPHEAESRLRLSLFDDDGVTVLHSITGNSEVKDGLDHLVEVGYDAVSGKLYIRVDGLEEASATVSWSHLDMIGRITLNLGGGSYFDEFWASETLPTLADHQDLVDAQDEAPETIPDPGAFTDPDAGTLYLLEVPIEHAPSEPVDEEAEYRYEYRRSGGDWTLLRTWSPDSLSGTLWSPPEPIPALDYRIRVRARGLGSDNPSNWVESATFGVRTNDPPADPVFEQPGNEPSVMTYERFVPIILVEPLSDPDLDPIEAEFYWLEDGGVPVTIRPWSSYPPSGWIWDGDGIVARGQIGAQLRDQFGALSALVWSRPFELVPERADYVAEFRREFQALGGTTGTSLTIRPDAVSLDHRTAFSPGPILVSDTSEGLLARAWRLRYDGNHFFLAGAGESGWDDEVILASLSGAGEMDFCFTQNGDPIIAVEMAGNLLIHWFDPVVGALVWENFGAGRTPKMVLDDPIDSANADVQVFYIAADGVYHRQQRDRFDAAYPVPVASVANVYLEEAFRGSDLRVHLVYSRRSTTTGRYALFVISTFPYPLHLAEEELEVSAAFVAGDLLEIIILSALAAESWETQGSFVGGDLLEIMLVAYTEPEELELVGSFVSGEMPEVVLPGLLDTEDLEVAGSFVSGDFYQVLFSLTAAPEGLEVEGSFVSGSLEVA